MLLRNINYAEKSLSTILEKAMKGITSEQIEVGQALYTKPFLSIYVWFALGLNCRFVWKCPSYHMLELYNQHVSANHLDIGVGTGYFLDQCRFPTTNPRIALMDLNPNCLDVAGRRLARYAPEKYLRNALEPIEIDAPGFDSIGILNLLHCLPGTFKTKGIVFEHLKSLLNTGGVLFGSTILYGGVRQNPLSTFILNRVNVRGFMNNKTDDLEGLRYNLEKYFSESYIEVIGCEALFWCK